MTKRKSEGEVNDSYTEYFMNTSSPKLKNRINVEALITEEVKERTTLG
jgi:hypothetical protein